MELNLGYFKMSRSKEGFCVNFSKEVAFPIEYHGRIIQGVPVPGNNLKNSFLSANQINDVIEKMCHAGNVVEYRICRVDLKEVPEKLLDSMVSPSKVLFISYTNLSTSQLSAVFKAIQASDVIEELYLREDNIKHVPAYQISASIPACRKVSLNDCSNNKEESIKPKVIHDSLSDILLEGKASRIFKK